MSLSFVLIAAIMCLVVAAISASDVIVNIEASKHGSIGVYFPGDTDAAHEVFSMNQKEQFLNVIAPGTNAREAIRFDTGLVLRSSDFKTRVRVEISKAPEEEANGNSYSISIFNLAAGDRGGDQPIELQHSTSGFIWIDGGMAVSHFTDVMHPFVIRNVDKTVVMTITLNPTEKDL